METVFTPVMSAAGGALIGLAAVLLLALHGRILGATGIVSGLLRFADARDWALRALLIAGMLAAPGLTAAVMGHWPRIDVPVGREAVVIGGLIVGIGVSFGGGCTSGHGVCGLARFSRRSAVAVVTFMTAAFATVFVVRHVLGS